jgi:hypothetical protein
MSMVFVSLLQAVNSARPAQPLHHNKLNRPSSAESPTTERWLLNSSMYNDIFASGAAFKMLKKWREKWYSTPYCTLPDTFYPSRATVVIYHERICCRGRYHDHDQSHDSTTAAVNMRSDHTDTATCSAAVSPLYASLSARFVKPIISNFMVGKARFITHIVANIVARDTGRS